MDCCFSFLQKKPQLTTAFWSFRGLGAPMRMMCVYSGVSNWKDVKYDTKQKSNGNWCSKEWEQEMKPKLQEHNPLVSLPYVINHTTGEVVSQSHAVYLYLGRLFNLNGQSTEEQLANEQVLCHLHTIWNENRDLVYPFKNNFGEEDFKRCLDSHFGKNLPAHYEKLNSWLEHRNTLYVAGRNPCTADFHVWEMLSQQEAMAENYEFASPLDKYARLKEYYLRFREIPRLKSYFDSDDARLPINNKMAHFK